MANTLSRRINEAGGVLLAIGIIGFIGVMLLVIYGNMGSVFPTDDRNVTTFTNQSGYAVNDTVYTLTGFTNTAGATSSSIISVFNATNGTAGFPLLIAAGNYTVSGNTITGAAGRTANYTVVNISYTVTSQGTSELNSNLVSDNITGGVVRFFGFSNTFFTFAAIVLLFTLFGILLKLVTGFGNKGGARFSD